VGPITHSIHRLGGYFLRRASAFDKRLSAPLTRVVGRVGLSSRAAVK